eukprot:1157637-Pelagomonas_calceolata.AAC.16
MQDSIAGVGGIAKGLVRCQVQISVSKARHNYLLSQQKYLVRVARQPRRADRFKARLMLGKT